MMVARVELSMSMPSEDKSLAQPVVTLVMMFEMLSLLHADWEQAPVNQLFIGWTREVLPAMARLSMAKYEHYTLALGKREGKPDEAVGVDTCAVVAGGNTDLKIGRAGQEGGCECETNGSQYGREVERA